MLFESSELVANKALNRIANNWHLFRLRFAGKKAANC